MGDPTRLAEFWPITEPGRAMRDGERPLGGTGEDERGGGPLPVYLRWVSVREKMACEREDCAFMSVSLVRRIEAPCRIRLYTTLVKLYDIRALHEGAAFARVQQSCSPRLNEG